ncbi:sulfur reduction protein DsrS [Thiohalocapsa halophila]|uniref:Sulfur reduction protein DsrS n=1 Tax=Thiohalocapsa halophila TaxID=69359 RepID=A0ABS1CF66_9GAMM|nr:sulfur reduction protein DsrS [Thiohalocapsa halophila]MBK1630520.1 sulfur reduction protein DsrS [Thiohalocapsa halophila]
MELASEDNFRLNVLLANKPKAIRIDESKLIVYGLSDKGEAKVDLNPTGRPEQYLRAVKELISGHILGSPGGYPVYLKRWTRMGQMRDESLEQLLMLGEPEAVVAAVGSPGLTEELARRAWWAMEDADNARRMLQNPNIVASGMGPVLADYVLDYLPFETETDQQTDSVRLILQPGLLEPAKVDDLWSKSGRKQAYLVGFLQARPDDLPQPLAPRSDADVLADQLAPLSGAGNPAARLLLRALSGAGQTYLKTVAAVLEKPPNQDVVTAAFDCLRDYFADLRPEGDPKLPLPELEAEARAFAAGDGAPVAVQALLASCPQARGDVAAMRILSGVGYGVIRPVLRDPTTLGSLMRRKLQPIMDPIQAQLASLRRAEG